MSTVAEERKVLLEVADLKVHFDIKDGKQAAGKLMRIAVNQVWQQAHFHHHRFDAVTHFLTRHFRMIGAQRLGDDIANRHTRI